MRILPLAGLALLLGGCTLAMTPQAPAGRITPAPMADAAAGRAVAACREQAAAQQLTVRGVDRSEEIRPAGTGPAIGQNVFLAVTRGGSSFVLRCNYSYDTATARIMTL